MIREYAFAIALRAAERGNAFIVRARGRAGTSRVWGIFYLARQDWLP